MDKEKTLLRLSTQIDTLKAHINRLEKSNSNIHTLDIDMLKKKTIEFYELVFELENAPVTNEKIIVEEVEVETKIEAEVEEEDKVEEKAETKIETKIEAEVEVKEEIGVEIEDEVEEKEETKIETKVKEEIEIENKVETKVKEEVEEKVEIKVEDEIEGEIKAKVEAAPEPKTEPIPDPPASKPEANIKQTTYDLFSESADSAVAEKFHLGEETSIAEKMQKTQISNIREAIGINEKFLFINELFNGDMGRYNKILDDINDLTTKKGVDTYLFEMKIQFQWADDNEAYIKLKELLDRKFG